MGAGFAMRFIVSIPITGAISCELEAESESDALAKAWDKYNDEGAEPFEVEWEATSHVTTGNVTHAFLNDQSAHRAQRTKAR